MLGSFTVTTVGQEIEYKNISINQFSNILCKQLLHNTFSNMAVEETHMPNLGSLVSQANPTSRTSLSFPTSTVQEDATTVSNLVPLGTIDKLVQENTYLAYSKRHMTIQP